VLTLPLAYANVKRFLDDKIARFEAGLALPLEQQRATARVALVRQLAHDLVRECQAAQAAGVAPDLWWAEDVVARLLDQARGRL
jgi:hypothetical protein